VPEPENRQHLGTKLTPRYLATLVIGAILILAVGSALRPRKPASEAVPPPSQTEVRRLQRLAERQSLETMTSHFAGIAADVAPHLVQLGRESATGIAWSGDLVVAAGRYQPAAPLSTVTTAGGDQLAASRVAGGPDLPLAAFEVAGRLDPVTRSDGGTPELSSGEWLVAVWRRGASHAFAPGTYFETSPVRCGGLLAREVESSLDLARSMAGAGLFDLDGTLVAVVLPCDGRYAALSPESVTLALVQGRSVEGRLRAAYGLSVLPLDAAVRRHLGAGSGVLVSELFRDYAAERAGLRPGDVIVGADSRPVVTPEDLQPLLAPTEQAGVVLTVSRAGKRREVRLHRTLAGTASSSPGPAGLGLAASPEGFAIGVVHEGSAAAEAGIRPGDRLLRVNFAAPRTAAEARRALSVRGEQPVFVEVQSGMRRFGALLR
jgi:hypothetical protein